MDHSFFVSKRTSFCDLHLHIEDKAAAFIHAFRLNSNGPTATFHNLLHNCKSKSDSLAVHLCSPVQLAKLLEHLRLVLLCNAHTSVLHMHDYALTLQVIVGFDFNSAAPCKL